MSTDKATLKDKQMSGSFVFQDREAGIFYLAFESEFKSYIETKFGVIICDRESPTSREIEDNRSPCSLSPLSQSPLSQSSRGPTMKVEFLGKQKQVTACRAYFDQMNTSTLMRTQVFFPCSDTNKYREIFGEKVRTTNDLMSCFVHFFSLTQ